MTIRWQFISDINNVGNTISIRLMLYLLYYDSDKYNS